MPDQFYENSQFDDAISRNRDRAYIERRARENMERDKIGLDVLVRQDEHRRNVAMWQRQDRHRERLAAIAEIGRQQRLYGLQVCAMIVLACTVAAFIFAGVR